MRLAVAPPLVAPNGQVRIVTTPANQVRAEVVATGETLWTLPARIPDRAASAQWRVLFSTNSADLFVQNLSDQAGLTYQGTRRIEANTGTELANDFKMEVYWYENVVLWTAVRSDGKLLMAVHRPRGAGYWVRTLDPERLRVIADVPHVLPPPIPGR